MLKDMDRAGVDAAIIVSPTWEGARNDYALEAVCKHLRVPDVNCLLLSISVVCSTLYFRAESLSGSIKRDCIVFQARVGWMRGVGMRGPFD